MKTILASLFLLGTFSAFAATCEHVDYSCPKGRGFLTEAQALGRVCLALKEAEIIDDSTPLHYSLESSGKQHKQFLLSLKHRLNECTTKGSEKIYSTYLDMSLTEKSLTGCISTIEIARTVRAHQRMVFHEEGK